ncbi:Protein of uncharacterised function (DUF3558) [Mycobacteroides abscessus subsp. abscessus]|nr:Protein of uncharacterised function (DUF3558) [Mycobacteroides abscessus subsp. abscessus]
MSGDGWDSMSHAQIVGKLSELKPDNAFNLAQKWSDIYTKVSDAAEHYRSADTKMSQIWTGEGPDAARMAFRDKYTELQSDEGIPAKAGKLQNALFQDGACLTNAGYVPQAYPVPPDSTDKDAKQKLLEAVRAEAQRLYTEPLDVTRPEVDPTQQGSSAEELKSWGVDPASVKDAADGLQRGCIWKGDGWVLQQLVNNHTISDYLNPDNYPDSQPLTVAGLQGSVDRGQQKGTTFCSVQIPSQKAVVATLVSVRDRRAEQAIPDACTKAIAIAADTATKLPK